MCVDADITFRAVRSALREARHSIYILSWDIDSRMRLIPFGANDGYPEELGEFLHALVSERKELHAYVLNWDFAMLYALEREWLPNIKLGWRTHRRMAFQMDGRHPVGASHHQKIIVVDDVLAFVGGLDLTRSRWDTPQHQWHDRRRQNADNTHYAPFHDVQAAVDGAAAHALGELCRQRWQRATGSRGTPPATHAEPIWPDCLQPDLTHVEVGISRTEPAYEGRAGVEEIRLLHLDAIAAARRSLFFENQYFTSSLIADALAARLREADGPDIVIVSPQQQSGWLEEATMGQLRARLQSRLRVADRYARYRLVCPIIPGNGQGVLNVHSKVCIVDDRLISIGSANLSNRSMACDTECNISVEVRGSDEECARIAAGIARLRSRLLAEHLGQSIEQVLKAHQLSAGLLRSIDLLSTNARRLHSFEPILTPELDGLIPEQTLFDPERPIDPEQLLAQLVPIDARQPLPRRMTVVIVLATLMLMLALVWRFTPLRDFLQPAWLISSAQQLEALPMTPLLIIAVYVIGGLLLIPVTLLIGITGIVFGTMPGTLYAMTGAMASAAVGYALGTWLGHDIVRRFLSSRINRLSHRLARRGILAMIVVRLLPLAPFGVVNIVAGASHIRLQDYLIGTAIGLAPGILLTTAFAHNLLQAIREPSAATIGVMVIVLLLLIAFTLLTHRLLRRRDLP